MPEEEDQCSLSAYNIEVEEGRRTNSHDPLTLFGRRGINTRRPLTILMRSTRSNAHHWFAMQCSIATHYTVAMLKRWMDTIRRPPAIF